MAIASTVRQYLDAAGIHYDVVEHPYTASSMQTAAAAHVPGDHVAKGVVLEDDQGCIVAVIPATHYVELGRLDESLHRHLRFAPEDKIASLFRDCEVGAVPAVGEAYGYKTIWDDSLVQSGEVYFEAGDHTDLVHIKGSDLQQMLAKADHGRISRRV